MAGGGLIPAPALVGFARVAVGPGNAPGRRAGALLAALLDEGRVTVLPFGAEAARRTAEANEAHGRGNGRGGPPNLLELLVLGCARAAGRAILYTGRDFAAARVALHPASRPR